MVSALRPASCARCGGTRLIIRGQRYGGPWGGCRFGANFGPAFIRHIATKFQCKDCGRYESVRLPE